MTTPEIDELFDKWFEDYRKGGSIHDHTKEAFTAGYLAGTEAKDTEIKQLKEALEIITRPFPECLTMDDLASYNAEIRKQFKLDGEQ